MSYKYYNETIAQFKDSLNCFELFNNRVVEGIIYKSKNVSYLNIGFKYLTTLNIAENLNIYLPFKVVCLETLFYDVTINYIDTKRSLKRFVIWSIISKAFQQKCFIKGKVLNRVRGGFSVGIYGFTCFLPRKIYLGNKTESIFYIRKINYLKKKIVLSQKNIHKIASKVLFKLSSRIIYISKN